MHIDDEWIFASALCGRFFAALFFALFSDRVGFEQPAVHRATVASWDGDRFRFAQSYFTEQFAPIFNWPDWTRRTSVFTLYGQPLAQAWLGMM